MPRLSHLKLGTPKVWDVLLYVQLQLEGETSVKPQNRCIIGREKVGREGKGKERWNGERTMAAAHFVTICNTDIGHDSRPLR